MKVSLFCFFDRDGQEGAAKHGTNFMEEKRRRWPSTLSAADRICKNWIGREVITEWPGTLHIQLNFLFRVAMDRRFIKKPARTKSGFSATISLFANDICDGEIERAERDIYRHIESELLGVLAIAQEKLAR